ncbi:MAG: hypothetical protein KA479_06710 [Saprospiraceae bacterium]|jgi:hypothetical protein|nr:hypothetical protein [Saprospiraceae bacterium]
MKQLHYWPFVLLLPLSVAAITFWIPAIESPWLFIGFSFLLCCLLVAAFHLIRYSLRKTSIEVLLWEGIVALFLVVPILAFLLLVNKAIPLKSRNARYEVMQRYAMGPTEPTYLFLWSGNNVFKQKLKSSHPASRLHVGDTMEVHYVTGLLGFEYIQYVD